MNAVQRAFNLPYHDHFWAEHFKLRNATGQYDLWPNQITLESCWVYPTHGWVTILQAEHAAFAHSRTASHDNLPARIDITPDISSLNDSSPGYKPICVKPFQELPSHAVVKPSSTTDIRPASLRRAYTALEARQPDEGLEGGVGFKSLDNGIPHGQGCYAPTPGLKTVDSLGRDMLWI